MDALGKVRSAMPCRPTVDAPCKVRNAGARGCSNLAGIERIADAGPAAIPSKVSEKLGDPLFTTRGMHPRAPASHMTAGPGNTNSLHGVAVGKIQFEPVARSDNPAERRPADASSQHHSIILQWNRTGSLTAGCGVPPFVPRGEGCELGSATTTTSCRRFRRCFGRRLRPVR